MLMIRLGPVPAVLMARGIVAIMGFAAIRLGAIRPPMARKDGD